MVSIAILGISVVLILELFSSGLRSINVGKDYNIGIIYAREKIDEILLNDELKEGEDSGKFEGGYLWKSRVTIFSNKKELRDSPFIIYKISVRVSWQKKYYDLVTLKTIKRSEIY